MARATARHILVDSREACENLKNQIIGGADFAEIARKYSNCPSGEEGGDLGEFGKGDMVKEFDDVVFSADLNVVHGPIETQFGFHLLEITSRSN